MGLESDRKRMIFDLPPEVRMAIKLVAVKHKTTTGAVVAEAIHRAYPEDVEQARKEIGDTREDVH